MKESEGGKDYFRTGCTMLDKVVGGAKGVYGVPAGKFINIVGDRSSGKTFVSNEFIAWSHYHYGKRFKWVYDDCESGYSFDTNSLYGFSIVDGEAVHSETVEEAFCNISNFCNSLKKGECGIYVIDSLDGLTSNEQDERAVERIKAFENGKTFDKGTYGMGKQKYLSQEFFPQLCSLIEKKNVMVIIVSQVREKIDMFSFEKYRRNGGKGLDFYAHTVLWLATQKKILKKENAVGVVVKAKTTKSKTPRPFRECTFSLLYDYGLDAIGSGIDYLYELRTEKGELNKKATALQWGDGDAISKTTLKDFLTKRELYEKFEDSRWNDEDGSDAENMLGFINSKKEYRAMFRESYGDVMGREELIAYIEENGLEEELEKRVDGKWEEFEASISSNRRRKFYANQPEGEK